MVEIDLKDLKMCGHKNTLLAYICVYQKGVISQDEIKELLFVTDIGVRDIGLHLVTKGMINTRMDSDNRVYFVIADTKYPFLTKCYKDCLKYDTKLVDNDDGTIKIKLCSRKMCKYNLYFNNFQKIKPVMSITQEYKYIHFEKHEHTDCEKDVLEWTHHELCEYFLKKYSKVLGGARCPVPKMKVLAYMKEFLMVVKRITGVREHRAYCKEHIDNTFKTLKSSDHFRMKPFLDVNTIRRSLYKLDKKWEQRSNVPLCGKFDINCINWLDNCCSLERDGINCTKTIREHMVKRYEI